MVAIVLELIPQLRDELGCACNLEAAGMHASARETGVAALRTLLRALGASEDAVIAVEDIVESDQSYENGKRSGQVAFVERAELLERLVSGTEEYFPPERDVRAHDSGARGIT